MRSKSLFGDRIFLAGHFVPALLFGKEKREVVAPVVDEELKAKVAAYATTKIQDAVAIP